MMAMEAPTQSPGNFRACPVIVPSIAAVQEEQLRRAERARAPAVGVVRESERLVGEAKLQAASKVGAVEQHLATILPSSEAEQLGLRLGDDARAVGCSLASLLQPRLRILHLRLRGPKDRRQILLYRADFRGGLELCLPDEAL